MASARDVSVVIDTYNQAAFIERAVESVLAQDWTGRVEIIVVDDGSTDDTIARLERLGTHVRVLRRENGGQAAALATGIAATTRGFVALLDGDDEWHPHHLRRVCEVADASGAAVVWSLTERIDGQGRRLADDPSAAVLAAYQRSMPDAGQALRGLVPWFPPTSGIAADGPLLRRLAKNLPRKLRVAADGWLQVALTLGAREMAWNLERTVRLRVHGGNAWTARDDFDFDVLRARRALYVHLADEVVTLDAVHPRRAEGLEQSLRAQAQEFAIWEHIVNGERAKAIELALAWSPPPWLTGGRRVFRSAHTLVATLLPVRMYRALQSAWRSA